ncbi:MAG: haloacid dehalogenase [Gammaproteobacteria bacterium RIFOXYA12_FULL_61_12]|nr:MAG: haloacid dehalogenase [Gammaproteobacteria bacterium RIFOXYA12_FULL_61_12]OGT90316.1 MAG: haloacid dehalogenase [Gammaproteobacteria bacterium RIFOXYD12_FULL_61_37]
MINWREIDTVLLDMDGTLLDLHFDNHFWLEYVPRRYAEARGLLLEEAKRELLGRYNDIQGTLEWYCVDHWSRELELDIALLKEEISHLIAVHPHVADFLEGLRGVGKRVVLVTNAHQKSLRLKMEKTQLQGHFDNIVCAHDLGHAKEEQAFWHKLQELEPFDPQRSLFVDDSLSMLRSARHYGIRWLLAVLRPDSKQPARDPQEFPAVQDFSEVMPVRQVLPDDVIAG